MGKTYKRTYYTFYITTSIDPFHTAVFPKADRGRHPWCGITGVLYHQGGHKFILFHCTDHRNTFHICGNFVITFKKEKYKVCILEFLIGRIPDEYCLNVLTAIILIFRFILGSPHPLCRILVIYYWISAFCRSYPALEQFWWIILFLKIWYLTFIHKQSFMDTSSVHKLFE